MDNKTCCLGCEVLRGPSLAPILASISPWRGCRPPKKTEKCPFLDILAVRASSARDTEGQDHGVGRGYIKLSCGYCYL